MAFVKSRFAASAGSIAVDSRQLLGDGGKESIPRKLAAWTRVFVNRCIVARCLLSPEDAIYCVKFLEAMFDTVVQVGKRSILYWLRARVSSPDGTTSERVEFVGGNRSEHVLPSYLLALPLPITLGSHLLWGSSTAKLWDGEFHGIANTCSVTAVSHR